MADLLFCILAIEIAQAAEAYSVKPQHDADRAWRNAMFYWCERLHRYWS